MSKIQLLRELEKKIIADTSLPLRESNLVFGEGNVDCSVTFVGEGPGFYEDRLMRPFVGRAGKLLDELIRSIGWKREDVYITNIIKRRPPDNRDPLPEEIAAYSPYLTHQIEIINPQVIAPLGRFSMNYFLPEAKIMRDQGNVFRIDGRIIVPLIHPAAALRSTGVLEMLKRSFKKLPDIVSGKSGTEESKIPPARAAEEKSKKQARLF